jgi:penicillin-binding protein 1B
MLPASELYAKFLNSPYRNTIRRTVFAVAATLLALLAVVGWYYNHCAHIIDAQLAGGPFHDSVNIYGASAIFTVGDALSFDDVETTLRLAGYENSYVRSSRGFEVSSPTPVQILMNGAGIAGIRAGGKEVKAWTVGYPLLENLSPGREKRRMVTFQDLPPLLVDAVISVEDRHFFHHKGIDVPRIVKAAYVDLRQHRKEQGASTLTMQLVRGLWLDPEKTWNRKISEILMTIHLERQWSKEQIFTAYANQVFLGRQAAYNIHGFAEASELFFGKDIRKLNASEAALLAGMVQRPSYFNPVRNPDHAKERRDVVLELMHENNFLNGHQYEEAANTPLAVLNAGNRADAAGAPYFLDMVQNKLYPEGTKDIYTTIDLDLQRAADEAVKSGMLNVDKLLAKRYKKGGPHAEAALIALDPHTGEIKAIIGGRNYARSQLNRIFAKRPPGSVFKPFVYAAAMNTGIESRDTVLTPASMVDDSATTFTYGNENYTPANFHQEAFGNVTLLQALAKSDNVAAVKVGQIIGFPAVVSVARRSGLNDSIRATPSVALGSYDVTPFEMAGAYTVFANGGTWVKPHIVRTEGIESRRVLDSRVAFVMTGMLEEVMRSGTAGGVRGRGFLQPAAGKTGTSHDGWFAGYTSQLLCLVWVGFDDYQELNLEGAKSALPIWAEFMKKASHLGAFRNAKEFSAPNGVVSEKICLDSGKLSGDRCLRSATASFISGTEPQEQCDAHNLVPVAVSAADVCCIR